MSERPPKTEAELVELVRSIGERAPQRLHDRVQSLVAASSPHRPRRGRGERAPAYRRRRATVRWGLLAGAPALVAVVAALVVVLPTGSGGESLTLGRTVALMLRPATMSAPSENPHNGAQLMVAVDGVPFPYWEESFGFRATGERIDRLGGRSVTTVFYVDSHGHWIGYAIVAGTPAPRVSGGVVRTRAGIPYSVHSQDGAWVVTWLRSGRLCVVAGHGVSPGTLLSLASWHGRGALPA